MNADRPLADQQLAALTAAFLRSSRGLQGFGWLLCALAGLGLLEAGLAQRWVASTLFALGLAGGFALAWHGLRIRFDIAAFEQIARHLGEVSDATALRAFDEALQRLGLRAGFDARGLAARAAATRRLVTHLALIVGLEFVLVLGGWIARHA